MPNNDPKTTGSSYGDLSPNKQRQATTTNAGNSGSSGNSGSRSR
ncbi:hypothetical protein OOJ91_12595 [Micromonospora lupini]|nr:hypothetical protein [Micromonospora lupini]MCX5066719.1 hypothetical protein [Micromonospora lupini]